MTPLGPIYRSSYSELSRIEGYLRSLMQSRHMSEIAPWVWPCGSVRRTAVCGRRKRNRGTLCFAHPGLLEVGMSCARKPEHIEEKALSLSLDATEGAMEPRTPPGFTPTLGLSSNGRRLRSLGSKTAASLLRYNDPCFFKAIANPLLSHGVFGHYQPFRLLGQLIQSRSSYLVVLSKSIYAFTRIVHNDFMFIHSLRLFMRRLRYLHAYGFCQWCKRQRSDSIPARIW